MVLPGDILIFDYRVLHRGCSNPVNGSASKINLLVFTTENMLENTDGVGASEAGVSEHHVRVLSGGGILLPSIYADGRSPDDVIAF